MADEHAPTRIGTRADRSLLGRIAGGVSPSAVRERLEILAGRVLLGGMVLTLGGAVLVGALVPHIAPGGAPRDRPARRRGRGPERRAPAHGRGRRA